MPAYMNVNPLSINFKPTSAAIPVYVPEVKGFSDSAVEPTQDDADAVAVALEALYSVMPAGQQAVVAQILDQASEAAAFSS